MNVTPHQIEQFASQHLQRFKPRGRQVSFLCEAHEDHNPSASVSLDTGLWCCHACGAKGDIFHLAEIVLRCDFQGAKEAILGPNSRPRPKSKPRNTEAKIVAVYPYTDEAGVLLYEKVRTDQEPPYKYYIRRPNGQGGYLYSLGDCRRVLYRLPAVLAASEVVVPEGEKDADTGVALGFCCTTNPFGAGDWRREYSLLLKGKERVLVIADNDEEGISHAHAVKADLNGMVKQVRVGIFPGAGKDLTDWVEAGGTAEQFREWIEEQFQKEEAPATAPAAVETPVPEVPESAWCDMARKYRKAVADSTEASDNFHLASFLTVAGAILGRSVFYRMPRPLYPNFYTALVGKSGRARKGTAMDFSQDIGRAVAPGVHWLSSIDSAEGFVQSLATLQERQDDRKTISSIIRFSELRSLIDKASREGTRSFIPKISDAFDSPPRLEVNTRNNPVTVENPLVSILGGASPRWIEKLKPEDLAGGIGNRFCWVIGKANPRNPWP